MNELPRIIQRAPALFYAAGLVYFVGSVILIHIQVGSMPEAPDGFDPGNPVRGMMRLVLIGGWLQALLVGSVLTGLGIIIRILLAIWADRRGGVDRD